MQAQTKHCNHIEYDPDCRSCKEEELKSFLLDIGVSPDNPKQYLEDDLCEKCGERDETYGGFCRYCHLEEPRFTDPRMRPPKHFASSKEWQEWFCGRSRYFYDGPCDDPDCEACNPKLKKPVVN